MVKQPADHLRLIHGAYGTGAATPVRDDCGNPFQCAKKRAPTGALKQNFFASLERVVERNLHLRFSFLNPGVGLSIFMDNVVDIRDGKP